MRGATWALLLAALAPPSAGALGFVAGFTPYCRVISGPGGEQEVTLLAPIPAGHGVHLSIVTSANVAYDHTSDDAGNVYQTVRTESVGTSTATLIVAPIVAPLPAGPHPIIVTLAAVASGTSCMAAFESDGLPSLDLTGFTSGSGSPAALDLGTPAVPGELVHAVLFGKPSGQNDPLVARDPPLTAITSGCVGTSSGRMCSFPSYAELADAAPFALSHTVTNPFDWGLVAVSFAPEPSAAPLLAVAFATLAAIRRIR